MNHLGNFLDCYMETDVEGHPTATYQIDVSISLFPLVVEGIKERFDSVEVVDQTNGQSVRSLRESFPNLVERARETHQKSILAEDLDRVANRISTSRRLQHHLPADELAKLQHASTLINQIRETTEKWKTETQV